MPREAGMFFFVRIIVRAYERSSGASFSVLILPPVATVLLFTASWLARLFIVPARWVALHLPLQLLCWKVPQESRFCNSCWGGGSRWYASFEMRQTFSRCSSIMTWLSAVMLRWKSPQDGRDRKTNMFRRYDVLHLMAINHMQFLLAEKHAEFGHDPRVRLFFFTGSSAFRAKLSRQF